METKELIPALRLDAEWAHANEWETPITLGDHLDAAADALAALLAVTAERDAAVEIGDALCEEVENCYGRETGLTQRWHERSGENG